MALQLQLQQECTASPRSGFIPLNELSVHVLLPAQLAMPYWTDPVVGGSARWKLAGVVGLTLATTGVR